LRSLKIIIAISSLKKYNRNPLNRVKNKSKIILLNKYRFSGFSFLKKFTSDVNLTTDVFNPNEKIKTKNCKRVIDKEYLP